MTPEFFDGLVATYGAPAAFIIWILWQSRGQKSAPDAANEMFKVLDSLKAKMGDIGDQIEDLQKAQQADSRQLDRIEIHTSRGVPVTHWNAPTQPPR